MWQYLLRRLLLIVPTLFGIVIVCFGIMQIVPGGPVELAIHALRGPGGGGEASSGGGGSARNVIRPEQIDELKKLYALINRFRNGSQTPFLIYLLLISAIPLTSIKL